MKLYIDMDGVLCDLDRSYQERFGKKPEQDPMFYTNLAQTPDFFAELDWMPDGQQLWNFVRKFKPTILSSPTNDAHCKPGKLKWLQTNIGNVPRIFETQKYKYAEPGAILIDDMTKNTMPWEKAGGTAILHQSAAATIAKLVPLLKKSDPLSVKNIASNMSISLEDRIKSKLTLAKSIDLLAKDEKDHSFDNQPLANNQNYDSVWHDHHTDLYNGLQTNQDFKKAGEPSTTTKHMHVFGFTEKPHKTIVKAPLDQVGLKLGHEGNLPKPSIRSSHYSFMLHPKFNTAHREAAFHKLASNVFGLGEYVPKTTVFRHPKTNEAWSAQEYIPNSTRYNPGTGQFKKQESYGDIHKMAIMESILGNNDRHRDNVLVGESGKPQLIDNALSFDYSHRYDTPIPSYAAHLLRHEVPQNVHRWISKLDSGQLQSHMQKMGAPAPIISMAMKRLDEVKRWSRYLRGNPHFSQDLGGALEAAQSHRFNRLGAEPINTDEVRNLVYDRIKRGHPFAAESRPNAKTLAVRN